MGGGYEVWETIKTLSVYAESVGGFFALLTAVAPSIQTYFKKAKYEKRFQLKWGKYEIVVKNEEDLKTAMKELKIFEKKRKNKNKKSKD